MVRNVIKGLLALGIIAGAAPFVLPLNEGRPLLSWSDLKAPPLPELPELPAIDFAPFGNTLSGKPGEPPATVTLYRWERGGESHFGDAPPSEGPYEKVEVPVNANIIRELK